VAEGHICGGRVCGSLPAVFGRCKHIVSFLVCLPLGCPSGWPAGVSSIFRMGEQPPSVWRTMGPPQVLPMCSVVCILSRFSHHTCPILLSSLVLRRAIKANRITCHYDSEGEYAEPLREARPITQRPIFDSTSLRQYQTADTTLGAHKFHPLLFIGRLISLMWLE
jgi:hypothetical protein